MQQLLRTAVALCARVRGEPSVYIYIGIVRSLVSSVYIA